MTATPPKPAEWDDLQFRTEMERLRTSNKWTQGQLAERLRDNGLPDFLQTTVSKIEKGTRSVRLGEARIIANTFGTTVQMMTVASDQLRPAQQVLEARNELVERRSQLETALCQYVLGCIEARDTAKRYFEEIGSAATRNTFGNHVRDASDEISAIAKLPLNSVMQQGLSKAKRQGGDRVIEYLDGFDSADDDS